MEPIILISNPGSSSRKYSLYKGLRERARIHFEFENNEIVCQLSGHNLNSRLEIKINNIEESYDHVVKIFKNNNILKNNEKVDVIGIRVVAPSEYFLETRLIDDWSYQKLKSLEKKSPIHISAILMEIDYIRRNNADTKIYGVSDSIFHKYKPDYAWNYGINIELADRLGIKRFGYHGLSAQSVVRNLRHDLPNKLVVCHLGSGSSISAILDGVSIDNTMGFSPLEGLIMATRSGSIDITATQSIKEYLQLDETEMLNYLNNHSGLFGLSTKSSDMRVLIENMEKGDHLSALAINTYIYFVIKAIGQMIAALGGIDGLVFTGTIGSRSAYIRRLVIDRLEYFGLKLDYSKNEQAFEPSHPYIISSRTRVNKVIVISTNEELEIARETHREFKRNNKLS